MASNVIDFKTGKPIRTTAKMASKQPKALTSTYRPGRPDGYDENEAVFGFEFPQTAPVNGRVWVRGLMPVKLAHDFVSICQDHNRSA